MSNVQPEGAFSAPLSTSALAQIHAQKRCDRPTGFNTASHHHPWNALILCHEGLIQIETMEMTAFIEPGNAAWIPAGTSHAGTAKRNSSVQLVNIDHEAIGYMPAELAASLRHPRFLLAPPLLRELVSRCASGSRPDAEVRRLIEPLILLETAYAPAGVGAGVINVPQHPVLQRLCDVILRNPRIDTSLQTLATAIGSSASTINRLFRTEQNDSFSHWRQRVLLQRALAMGRNGRSLGRIAHVLGYTHATALSAMIRRQTGWSARQLFADGSTARGGKRADAQVR